ncbi:hypothetical protein L1049_018170 [Liquidambar formosana]|uniref:Uncharacterized protein n=1 Tax=Liquidambar formosana TaxID=63359 RepID=A0AAP0R9P0_LIQFO
MCLVPPLAIPIRLSSQSFQNRSVLVLHNYHYSRRPIFHTLMNRPQCFDWLPRKAKENRVLDIMFFMWLRCPNEANSCSITLREVEIPTTSGPQVIKKLIKKKNIISQQPNGKLKQED